MKGVIIVLFSFLFLNLNAQIKELKELKYFARDQVIFDLNYNYWMEDETTTQQTWNSFGCSFYAIYNLIGKHSNICLASGFGMSIENINLETQPDYSSGKTVFTPIQPNIDYSKNKIALTYLEVPLEIRIRTNPNPKRKSFIIYIGAKAGYLINNHMKYVGDDVTGKWVKYKLFDIENIMKYRYGATFRIGFGKLNISGFYSLTSLFEKEKGPEIIPVNIGISLFLF